MTSAEHKHTTPACLANGAPAAQPALRGRTLRAESMARHTSWRVGGPADRFYIPADTTDLEAMLSGLPRAEPLAWIGLGSNVLVRDGGVRGTVICVNGMRQPLELLSADTLRVGCGVACAKVARFSAAAGLTGAEFLAGIPGSVGGALAMNAGAFGQEIWRIVEQVETLTRAGQRRQKTAADFAIAYRQVDLPADEWFTSAVLQLVEDTAGQAQTRIRELLAQRAHTQPTGQPSCGSVFKNPANDHAGRLVEQCGLKGFAVGAARVSEKHANFIVHTGQASAADIETLMLRVQDEVAAQTGVRLVPEVRIIGEPL